ncbi:hypothetical protein GCM10009858_46550 [Terrabacter carboxydivorans]|uniref:Minor capsid protein n=1 Tax=Terrabacter carboxydivorans TaxID=619730 RepID=A0ABN3MN18_9MICO
MFVSPDDGARLAPRVLVVIDDAEAAVLRLLATRPQDGRGQPHWAPTKLAELPVFRVRVARLTAALAGAVATEVNSIVLDAYNRVQALAVADLSLPPILSAEGVLDGAAVIAESTADTIVAAMKRVPDMVTAAYREAAAAGDEDLGEEVAGVQTVQRILESFASRGVARLSDGAGCDWSLEDYVEMAIGRGAGLAAVRGYTDARAASGIDLVIVSDSPRACPLCRPFGRQVLSISGRVGKVIEPNSDRLGRTLTDVKAPLTGAISKGLFHFGCRHELSAYLPGATRPYHAETKQRLYEAWQRQREAERKIHRILRRRDLARSRPRRRRRDSYVRFERPGPIELSGIDIVGGIRLVDVATAVVREATSSPGSMTTRGTA